ncbi:MAG: DUF4296 domain-containing protein [Chitinophagaceae bacterium]
MIRLLPVLLLLLFACNNKNLPKDVLRPEKMHQVLFDVMQADELVNLKYTADTSLDRFSQSIALYQTVFKIHKISADDFKRSFKFYQNHPELLKPILDSLQKITQRRVDTSITSYPVK